MTAPAWTGPPSNVSSKSSPWIAVPLTSAAAAARQRARMTDGGARPIVIAAGQRSFHIVFVARGDGEADHVDQQILALGPHGIGQARHIERANLLRQMLGNGGLGKLC